MSIHDDNKAWFKGFIGEPKNILSSLSESLSYDQGKKMREGNANVSSRAYEDIPLWKSVLIIAVMAVVGVVLFFLLSNRGVGTGASLSISITAAFIVGGATVLMLDYIGLILLIALGYVVYKFVGPLLHG